MAFDLDTAKKIVKQFYPKAADPALEDLLNSSKGKDLRPYYVAAFFIWSDYRQLIKADEASWNYDKVWSILGLLNMQKAKDCNDGTIDPCFVVDGLLLQVNGSKPGSGSGNDGYEPAAIYTAGMDGGNDSGAIRTADPLTQKGVLPWS